MEEDPGAESRDIEAPAKKNGRAGIVKELETNQEEFAYGQYATDTAPPNQCVAPEEAVMVREVRITDCKKKKLEPSYLLETPSVGRMS